MFPRLCLEVFPLLRNMALKVANLFDMQERVCLVTGGSRGIGLMIARAFVQNGARVYISSRKKQVCDKVAAELSAMGPGKAFSLPFDLKDDATARLLAAELAKRESKLDCLVNNAGITWGEEMATFPEAQWQRVMNLNVYCVFHLTRACLPLLKKAAKSSLEPAHVINLGSIAAEVTYPGSVTPSYEASKAAVHHLTRYLASQLVNDHINVNCIAPAIFASKMTQFMLNDQAANEAADTRHPVGRIGQETDMAGAALFLATKASAFTTGSVLYVDGGKVAIRCITQPTESNWTDQPLPGSLAIPISSLARLEFGVLLCTPRRAAASTREQNLK
eukprot:g69243.t1